MPHFLDSWFPSEDGFEKQSYAEHIHPHFHYGHPCKCPWGRDMERFGHVKEAAKIDWLRGRKDMQDEEGKAFLDRLERLHFAERADKLLPWVVREWRRGRLYNHPSYGGPAYRADSLAPVWNPMGTAEDNWGAGRGYGHQWLTANHLQEWQKLLDEMKNHRQGIDVMQHSIHELAPKMKNFEEFLDQKRAPYFGETYHTFDDGWTIRRLQDAKEAQREGKQMGHCVGSYGHDIENGESHIWSLRDPNNQPHATMEIANPRLEHRETGDVSDSHGVLYDKDANLDPNWSKTWKPVPHPGSSITQFYGKQDSPPIQEYVDRMNEWLEPHGLEGAADEHGQDPWWPEYYTVPGATTVGEYTGDYHGTGEGPEPPDEYYTALHDAEEWGMEPPELEYDPPNFSNIFADHTEILSPGEQRRYHWQRPNHFNPEEAGDLWDVASHHGHTGEFADAYRDWMHNNYNPNDPNHRTLNEWWKKTIGENTNPETGEFEEPRWANTGWETAMDRWWGQNLQQYPQLPADEDPESSYRFWQPVNQLPPIPDPVRRGLLANGRKTPPLYYRWVFSPDTGEVVVGHNEEGHPALVRYHKELAGELNRPNLTHGYAYRLVGGWRLTDWEHKPLEDPFITSQILNKLGEKASIHEDNSWVPAQHDYDRSHYGLPTPKDSS